VTSVLSLIPNLPKEYIPNSDPPEPEDDDPKTPAACEPVPALIPKTPFLVVPVEFVFPKTPYPVPLFVPVMAVPL
jgi:hypothetical protein